ncbi:MAG: hypothetical protein ACYDAO_00790 [Thermoplasmataceae archaeon]
MIEETPCLEPDTRNGSIWNLRGGAGNRLSKDCLNGMLDIIKPSERTALAFYSTINLS